MKRLLGVGWGRPWLLKAAARPALQLAWDLSHLSLHSYLLVSLQHLSTKQIFTMNHMCSLAKILSLEWNTYGSCTTVKHSTDFHIHWHMQCVIDVCSLEAPEACAGAAWALAALPAEVSRGAATAAAAWDRLGSL